jgi:hypothetical protein
MTFLIWVHGVDTTTEEQVNNLLSWVGLLRGAGATGAAGAAAPLPFVDGGSGGNFALCS